MKAKAVAAGAEHDISESTIKRAIAKAKGKTPKKKKPIPKAYFDKKTEIEAELKRLGHPGAEFCNVVIFDAKQSKAMGGPAEPHVGWWSSTACTGDVAKEAIDAAVASIQARTVERAEGKTPKRRTKAQIAEDNHLDAMAVAEGFGEGAPIEAARHAYLVALERLEPGDVQAEAAEMIERLRLKLSEILEIEFATKTKRPCRKCHGAGTITSKKAGTTVDCDCVREEHA